MYLSVLQAAEAALVDAARQWNYLQQDNSIFLDTNLYTVITATA